MLSIVEVESNSYKRNKDKEFFIEKRENAIMVTFSKTDIWSEPASMKECDFPPNPKRAEECKS